MRLALVIGTRPQIIKSAALLPALRDRHEVTFIDTGQHYDLGMAGAFFAELGLPQPDIALGLTQTSDMIWALNDLLPTLSLDAVVTIGDTNSTYAASVAAMACGIPSAHVEAGLRSFDPTMPEERNRIEADRLAQWCFVPTETARTNLCAEGRVEGVEMVGDVLADVLAMVADEVPVGEPAGSYLFATIHRVANRSPEAVEQWASLLSSLDRPVVLALHPGTGAVLKRQLGSNVSVIEPQGYRASIGLQANAAAVLTDSGGISREAHWLGVPCVILRETTEWPETGQPLVGLDPERARSALDHLLAQPRHRPVLRPSGASSAIAAILDQRQSVREIA